MGGCRVILLDLGGGRTHLQTCSSVIGIGKKTHTTHIHAHTHTHTCSSVISIGKRTHTTHIHTCTHSHACSSVTSTILSLSFTHPFIRNYASGTMLLSKATISSHNVTVSPLEFEEVVGTAPHNLWDHWTVSSEPQLPVSLVSFYIPRSFVID